MTFGVSKTPKVLVLKTIETLGILMVFLFNRIELEK